MRKSLCLVLVTALLLCMLPAAIGEELIEPVSEAIETEELELVEEEIEEAPAAEVTPAEDMPTAAAIAVSADIAADGGAVLTARVSGSAASGWWQRLDLDACGAMSESEREACWQDVCADDGSLTLSVPASATTYAYRLVAETADGIVISDTAMVAAAGAEAAEEKAAEAEELTPQDEVASSCFPEVRDSVFIEIPVTYTVHSVTEATVDATASLKICNLYDYSSIKLTQIYFALMDPETMDFAGYIIKPITKTIPAQSYYKVDVRTTFRNLKPGSCYHLYTVAVLDGEMYGKSIQPVNTPKTTRPTKIALNYSGTVTMSMLEDLQLDCWLEPVDRVDCTVTYKSSNERVAKVTSSGYVYPVGEGTAVISAVAGTNRKTATFTLKVVDPFKLAGVTLSDTGTVELAMGDTRTLYAENIPDTATDVSYTWKSSNERVATVSNGTVYPKSEGVAVITVTATRGTVKKTATVRVKVYDPYKPTGVSLNLTGTQTVNLSGVLMLSATVQPYTAVYDSITWKSSNTKVATVFNGTVDPQSEGMAVITVTMVRGSIRKSASVTVKVVDEKKPTALKLSEGTLMTVQVGTTFELNPYLEPCTAVCDGDKVGYTWAATGVVTPTNGKFYANKVGTVAITAKITYGRIVKTARITIRVVK